MENQTLRIPVAYAMFSLCLIAQLVAGCSTGERSVRKGAADGFIDCLVAGQIRQLDEKVAYPTQRQLIRVTREECRVRGGEEQ